MKWTRVALLTLALLIGLYPVGAKPEQLLLNDAVIELLKWQDHPTPLHEDLLTIFRAGGRRFELAAPDIEIEYERSKLGAGPDLIVTEYSGGAHCCLTVHVLQLGTVTRDDPIEIGDSGLDLDRSASPPRLRFDDFGFALEEEIKTGIVHWHAPPVVLSWNTGCGCYRPDLAAMRRPAPDGRALGEMARALRAELDAPQPEAPALDPGDHELDQELWGHMVDLIYAGNALSARRLLDLAWPASRPGRRAFLAEFTEELHRGEIWRRYHLGELLGADSVFS